MLQSVTAAVLALSTVAGFAAPPAAGTRVPPAGQVTIEKLKVNGTGCRNNTTAVAISPDKQAFTVTYSAYLAQAGGTTKRKDEIKACSITVRLGVPAGWTYAVSQVTYRGFAHLEPGATAVQRARYHFQGSGAPSHTSHPFPAGLDDVWQVTDTEPAGKLVYGACGKERKIDIDTELQVKTDRDDTPLSILAMDSTDGEFTTRYGLVWKNC